MTHLFGLKQSRLACISLVLTLLAMVCPCSFAEDCNRNGVEDEQDIAAETSADCDSDGVPDECQLFPVDFSSRELGVTVSRYPRAVICVDVDSDGILDIVTANKDGDTRSMVTVLKNDGSGIFERADFEDAVRASDLDAADFDGDGANDLLTANYYTLELLWNDGTGSFEERESIAVERGTRYAAAGDFNGDGLADIVSTNDRSNRAWVYINAGERSFSEPVAYGVGSVPSVVRVVDIEGDGDLDICTVNVGSGTITILQNDGNGGFGSVRTVVTGLASPAHLAVADFDLDGSADFAVASDDNIAILYGGDFSEREVFAANAGELVVADLDGDGDTDLGYSILASRRIAVLLNVSGVFFSQPGEFAVDIEAGLLAAGHLA
ncbi:MAG: VCBS repeat-containing protein, partial [Planctomycetes bacterium]|nr:VCBS repeat-containing protein [Planctomycetota bacterium]